MDKSFYLWYLKSAAWQAKRELYFNRHGKRCQACGTIYGPIQLHHMTYEHLGHEPLTDLIALCAKCHREVETLYRRSGRGDRRATTMAFVKARKRQRGTR